MDPRANRFLEDFTPGGREKLVSRLVYHDPEPGEFLFREGEVGDGVYLVLEGEIELIRAVGGHEQILSTAGDGDYFGEVSLLDGLGRSTSARAKGIAMVASIPVAPLLEVLITEPVTLTMHLFQNVLHKLRRTNELYVEEVVRKEKLALIGEMAGSLMHDLRNPMQVILSSTELIRMDHDDENTVASCEKIQQQCERLVNMSGELLEFSKGETKLHLTRTDTKSLLAQFRAANEIYLEESRVAFDIKVEPAEIEVDETRLQRALQNLVSNAMEALAKQPGARVEVRFWVLDSVLHLCIGDNGPGIADKVRDRLFEPFVTYGKTGGTGLGLAIVSNVITAHRGTITFETEAGRGTRFLIRLPQDSKSPAVAMELYHSASDPELGLQAAAERATNMSPQK